MNLAFCGLDCGTCPIHLATLESDGDRRREMKISIARQCRDIYQMQITPKDVTDCDGCCSGSGRLFAGCASCEIRKCAMGRGLENCAGCSAYACDLLEIHFKLDPDARKRLDGMRNMTKH